MFHTHTHACAPIGMETCGLCNMLFVPESVVGRWECRMHTAEASHDVPGHEGRYVRPCCGYDAALMARVMAEPRRDFMHAWFDVRDMQGCVRCDHMTAERLDSGASPYVALLTDTELAGTVVGAGEVDPGAIVAHATPHRLPVAPGVHAATIEAAVRRAYYNAAFQRASAGGAGYAALVKRAQTVRATARRTSGPAAIGGGGDDDSDAVSVVGAYWSTVAPPADRPAPLVTVLQRRNSVPDAATVWRQQRLFLTYCAPRVPGE